MTLLDAFTYKTIELDFDPGNNMSRIPAHCLGDLATCRLDTWLKRLGLGDNAIAGAELWGIIMLNSGAFFYTAPIFGNLDDAAGFIVDVTKIHPRWAEAARQDVKAYMPRIIDTLQKHKGYPLAVMFDKYLPKDEKLLVPKTGPLRPLNGYPSRPIDTSSYPYKPKE